MVMHTAMADSKLSPDALSKVVAGAMFGDPTGRPDSTKETTTAPVKGPMGGMVPPFPAGLKDKVVINCAEGDPVGSILTLHWPLELICLDLHPGLDEYRYAFDI